MASRVLRFAHLTDIHIQPERRAAEGLAQCLREVQSLPDPPSLIVTGGDQVMNSFGESFERTKTQWDLFQSVLAAENSLPIEHTIGNHDVWGWGEREGKKWAMEELGLSTPYRWFDKAGWRFIILDSTHPKGDSYTAKLDEEQFEWLAQTLAETPTTTPVIIVSHIPIIAFCPFFDGDNEASGEWQVPGAWMHIDARRIKSLFLKHPQVKLAISGHVHLVDRVDYCGVTYFCNGAVCGGWWKGAYQECDPGYALVDLFEDGSFRCDYSTFRWNAEG